MNSIQLAKSALLLLALGSCKKSTPAPEPPTPPAETEVASDAALAAQACANHISAVPPNPDYPTWTTSCAMPELPPGYPAARPIDQRPWRTGPDAAVGPLSVDDPANITKLLDGLMAYVEPVFNDYIQNPVAADTRPDGKDWRMMPWLGDVDCQSGWGSGRDSSAGMSTGQVIPAGTLPGQRTDEGGQLQNHSITWYDPWGAYALSSVFGSPLPKAGDPSRQQMADGTVIVKMAVLTPYADGTDWPIVEGAPMWPVYRPPVGVETNFCKNPDPSTFKLLQTHVLQFDVILKSSYYAPETEWVFATWIYDPSATGDQPLDRYTALGAMWGNDPGIEQTDFCTPVSPLQQSWINPGTPEYGYQQLGWGCRLSGPIDVARRQATFTNGSSCENARISSCMSCHGTSEYPTTGQLAATMYPLDKGYNPFIVSDPGSEHWWNWFQSRPPTEPQGGQQGTSKDEYIAFDYDMIFITSVPVSQAAGGDDALEEKARAGQEHLTASRRQGPIHALQVSKATDPQPPPGCDCSCVPKK